MTTAASWAAILAAVVPVVLAFVVGLLRRADSTEIEDGPEVPGKLDELNDALAAWKKANGAP